MVNDYRFRKFFMRLKSYKIDLSKIWIFLFIVCFLFVPYNFVSEGFRWATVFLASGFLIGYKLKISPTFKFPVLLFAVAFAVRFAIAVILKTPPESDFEVLLNASRSVLEGDLSFLESLYFKLWTYQLGFVYFQSFLLSICNRIIFLKAFNCLFASLTTVLVYLIAKEFVSEKAARTASLLYCFLPFPLFYVTVLSNQFSASFLIYLGIYIVISKNVKLKCIYRYLVFGVLAAFANVLRPESIVPLFGCLIFLILTINKTNLKQQIMSIIVLIGVYFLLFSLISSAFTWAGLSENGLSNNASYWKFVLGFNHESSGQYSDADTKYLLDSTAAWQIVKERITMPLSDTFKLFGEKIAAFWSGGTVSWSFAFCLKSGLTFMGTTFRVIDEYLIIEDMNRWIVFVINLFVIFGVFKYLKNNNFDKRIIFIVNQLFVTFGVYLLIEVQSRYVYYAQIALLILAALGIDEIVKIIKNLREFRKIKYNNGKEETNG